MVEVGLATLLITFLRSTDKRVAIQSILISFVYANLEILLNGVGFFKLSDDVLYHVYYYLIFGMFAFSMIKHPKFDTKTITQLISLTLYMTVLEDIFYWIFSFSDPVSYFMYPVYHGLPIDQFIIFFFILIMRWKNGYS
ncbi:MAG: hypothetical protein QW478_04215 [Candidatus Micrarchaeaceae archaeon]